MTTSIPPTGLVLDATHIVATLEKLRERVSERFPKSGLAKLCGKLVATGRVTAAQADALAKRLGMYRLRRPIVIARDKTLGVHWSSDGDGDPRLPALGRRWLGAPDGEPADDIFRAHRLRLGVAEGVAELGIDKTLWLETNAVELHGVSFTKGCYVGQENTARMNWRQKVNRRLVVLAVEADPGEAARTWYPELGLAVAPVRVEQLRSGAPVRLGTVEGRPIVPDWLAAAIAEEPVA